MKDEEYYNNLDKRTKEYKEYKASDRIGDKIANVTKAMGIEPCEGCNKRKDNLNLISAELEFFFKKHKPNEFEKPDLKLWETFLNRKNQNEVNGTDQRLIIRLLKDVLNMSVKPCGTCSGRVWNKYIGMINVVYDITKTKQNETI